MDEDEKVSVQLGRLDERLKAMDDKFDTAKEKLDTDIQALTAALIKYVTKAEFWPVKAITLGFAALALSSIIAALMAKLIR
jgi:hypothetical protein